MKTTKPKISKVKLKEVKIDLSIYPRLRPSTMIIEEYSDALASGAKFPPIILEKGTNRILDGYHRMKACFLYREKYDALKSQLKHDDAVIEPPKEIECEYHTIPKDIDPKLYALYLSSKNGLRPSSREKEIASQTQYQKHPGSPLKTVAKYAGVSLPTVRNYLKPLLAEFEETKRSIIMRLNALGWTQDEISEKLNILFPDAKGVSQDIVSDFLRKNEKFHFSVKNDLTKGHEPQTVAMRHNLPQILAWNIALAGLEDPEKFDRLDIKIQPYNVWHFNGSHKLYGKEEYPGHIPGALIAHTLYFFTNPGDVVIDPMVGSGTTPDVCLAMDRKCYSYDFDNRYKRPDILYHDIALDGWTKRIKKADLIFFDPPYFNKIETKSYIKKEWLNISQRYKEGSISKFSREEYLNFFIVRLAEAATLVKKGTKLAFLNSDFTDYDEPEKSILVGDYSNIISNAGWKIIKHIQVPVNTHLIHPETVLQYRKNRKLANLNRYLLIAET